MSKYKIFILVFIGALLTSCAGQNEVQDIVMADGCGALSLSMESQSLTRATGDSGLKVPSTDEFFLTITPQDENSEQEIITYHYADIPVAIVLKEGDYSITAMSESDEPFSVEMPTYKAVNTAVVEINHITNIVMTATMYSYAVEIRYGEDFLNAFESFWVEVHVGDGRYEYANGKDEICYITPGYSRYILKGTTTEGQAYSSVFSEVTSEGCEHHILNLSIRPLGHEFELLVDTEVISQDVNADIDPSLYPDMSAPVFGGMEFYETEEYSADDAANSNISFRALTTFDDIDIQFNDSKFEEYGFDTQKVYSFANAEDVTALESLGVVMASGGIEQREAVVNVGALAQRMECPTNEIMELTYSVKAVDKLINTEGENSSVEVSGIMTINPPEFSMPDVPLGNIWTKEFTITEVAQSNISKGNLDVMNQRSGFTYEYSSDKENWSTINSLYVSGLPQSTSGNKYYVRATYRFYTSEIVELTTEATTQIPNNTFATNYSTENNGQPCYWFFASGATSANQWWATRNAKTTSEGIDAKYTRYSGSRPTDGDGVQLVTCGWGAGNTAAILGGSVVKNIWAGAIFLGTYTTDTYDNSSNEHHGKEFNSRPTDMIFSYKYDPYSNSDNYIAKIWLENRTGSTTTQLAYGQSTSTANQSSWKTVTINLDYSNTTLPITHLCVAFYSGKNEGSKDYVKHKIYAWESCVGSVFYVNNVTLVYNK